MLIRRSPSGVQVSYEPVYKGRRHRYTVVTITLPAERFTVRPIPRGYEVERRETAAAKEGHRG